MCNFVKQSILHWWSVKLIFYNHFKAHFYDMSLTCHCSHNLLKVLAHYSFMFSFSPVCVCVKHVMSYMGLSGNKAALVVCSAGFQSLIHCSSFKALTQNVSVWHSNNEPGTFLKSLLLESIHGINERHAIDWLEMHHKDCHRFTKKQIVLILRSSGCVSIHFEERVRSRSTTSVCTG